MSSSFRLVRAPARRRRRGRTRRSARPPRRWSTPLRWSGCCTAPRVLRRVQVWQMPIRHPLSGVRPAASACSSSGRPSSASSTPLSVKVTRPPEDSAGTVNTGGTKLSELRIGAVLADGLDQSAVDRTRTPRRARASRRPGASASKWPSRSPPAVSRCSRAAPARRASRRVRRGSRPPRRCARSGRTRSRRRSPSRAACAASTSPA